MTKLFMTVLNMSITGTLVILAVLVLRLLFKRLPRIYSYLLWSVVLLRLICPFAIEADFGIIPSIRIGEEQAQREASDAEELRTIDSEMMSFSGGSGVLDAGEEGVALYDPEGMMQSGFETDRSETVMDAQEKLQNEYVLNDFDESMQNGQSVQSKDIGSQWHGMSELVWQMIAGIWLVGVLLLVGYGIFSYCRLVIKLRELPEPPIELAGHEGYRVISSDSIGTPFVVGFLRPTIYLPAELTDVNREMVMEHEKTHIHRKDYFVKSLAYLVTCIHWFNPLVWLSFYLLEADIETSCDEAVLRRVGYDRKKTYAKALLALSSDRMMAVGRCPLAFGENNVKERIKNAVGLKKVKTWIAVVSAILVLGVIIVLSVNQSGKDNHSEVIKQQEADALEVLVTDAPTETEPTNAPKLSEEPETTTVSATLEEPDAATASDLSEEVSDADATNEAEDGYAVLLRKGDGNYDDVQILYSYPVESGRYENISVDYGKHIHPVTGAEIEHSGVDFSGAIGHAIYAAADGTVLETGTDTYAGNYVILSHNNGEMTYYAHCSNILVEVGQVVVRGDTIARMGDTGMSTGAYLHFAVSYDDAFIRPVFEEWEEKRVINELYQAWQTYYLTVWLREPVYIEEHWEDGYAFVDPAVFPSIAYIKEWTEEIFTVDCATENFYDKYLNGEAKVYFEQNGQLCRSTATFTSGMPELRNIWIEYASDELIKAGLSCHEEGVGEIIINMELTKVDGEWRISWYQIGGVATSDRLTDSTSVLLINPSGNYYDVEILYTIPLPEGSYRITSPYGKRVHPVTGAVLEHNGIDFAAEEGTDIYAAADGWVYETGFHSYCGNYVIVCHDNGEVTYYMHCSEILVEDGQSVTRGETIARVGSTGASTGPHLHFAVSYGGEYIEPVFEAGN